MKIARRHSVWGYLLVSGILAAMPATHAFAQDAEDDKSSLAAEDQTSEEIMEEVVVTGRYRESLAAAIDLKRNAINVRDSIVAEDIGKFPDLNIAEAIQRVPGVAISREGGEGRNITLRGFSPEFTRTTLNGMEVPAGSDGLDSGGITVNSGRAFDFHVFASELFNRVDVNKTQTASIEEGGIAGTVDMYSAKPFDFDGFSALVSAQAGYNDLTDKVDPRIAFLISDTFLDDTLGVLASVAYSKRTVRQEGFGSVRWTSPYIQGDSWADTDPVVNGTPAGDCPAEDPLDCLWAPRLPRADFFGNDQERLGLTASVQYRPTDNSEITFDWLYSDLTNDRENYNSMEWFLTHGDPGNFTGQYPLEMTVDSTGKVLVAGRFDDVTSWYESRQQNSDSKFNQLVLSGVFNLSDPLELDAMVGYASNDADRQELRFYYRSVPHYYAYDYSNNEVAAVDYGDYDMSDPNNFLDVSNASHRNHDVKKDNFTTKLDLTYQQDTFSIKAGLAYNDRKVDYSQGEGNRSFSVDPTIYSRPFPYSDFGTGLSGPPLVPFMVADWAALKRDGVVPQGYTETAAAGWKVTEQTTAAYLEVNGDYDIGNMMLRTNFGVRWVETKVTSEALVKGLPVKIDRSYDNFLPSMNLALDITPDLVGRLSYGRTMTRPGLGSLNIAQPNFGITTATVSNLGNPDLNPYESDDFELGLSWYIPEGGILAATWFHKNIITSLKTDVVLKMVDEVWWPVIYADPQYDPAFGNDPAVVPWTHVIPVNSSEGYKVQGYELMYQQPFTFLPGFWSGFGITANYTHVQADDSTGLSPNSYNFTFYYDQENFSARISMNKRDDYLLQMPSSNGNVAEYKYGPTHWDFSSHYNFNDQWTLLFEIINLTDEVERIYGTGDGTLDLTREFSHTGRQYFLGVRYSF